jgi:hypothetical protein
VLAAEVGVVGLTTAVGVIVGMRQQRSGQHPARALTSMLLLGVPLYSGIQIPKNQKPQLLKSGLKTGVTQFPL